MSERSYTIFTGEYIPRLGTPLLCVTSNVIGHNDESCEYFLVFTGDPEKVICKRVYGPISFIREQMISEGAKPDSEPGLTYAKQELTYQLDQKYLETNNDIYVVGNYKFVEVLPFHLYSLFMSRVITENTLLKIHSKSVNIEFRKYVENVLNSEPFEPMDLIDD